MIRDSLVTAEKSYQRWNWEIIADLVSVRRWPRRPASTPELAD